MASVESRKTDNPSDFQLPEEPSAALKPPLEAPVLDYVTPKTAEANPHSPLRLETVPGSRYAGYTPAAHHVIRKTRTITETESSHQSIRDFLYNNLNLGGNTPSQTNPFDMHEAYSVDYIELQFTYLGNWLKANGKLLLGYNADPACDTTFDGTGNVNGTPLFDDRVRFQTFNIVRAGENFTWKLPVEKHRYFTRDEGDIRNYSPGTYTWMLNTAVEIAEISYEMTYHAGVTFYCPTIKVGPTNYPVLQPPLILINAAAPYDYLWDYDPANQSLFLQVPSGTDFGGYVGRIDFVTPFIITTESPVEDEDVIELTQSVASANITADYVVFDFSNHTGLNLLFDELTPTVTSPTNTTSYWQYAGALNVLKYAE